MVNPLQTHPNYFPAFRCFTLLHTRSRASHPHHGLTVLQFYDFTEKGAGHRLRPVVVVPFGKNVKSLQQIGLHDFQVVDIPAFVLLSLSPVHSAGIAGGAGGRARAPHPRPVGASPPGGRRRGIHRLRGGGVRAHARLESIEYELHRKARRPGAVQEQPAHRPEQTGGAARTAGPDGGYEPPSTGGNLLPTPRSRGASAGPTRDRGGALRQKQKGPGGAQRTVSTTGGGQNLPRRGGASPSGTGRNPGAPAAEGWAHQQDPRRARRHPRCQTRPPAVSPVGQRRSLPPAGGGVAHRAASPNPGATERFGLPHQGRREVRRPAQQPRPLHPSARLEATFSAPRQSGSRRSGRPPPAG